MKKSKLEPYAILFPLGAIQALIGVSLWLFFRWGWLGFYPRIAHAYLMNFGFLFSFVSGFLMTAIPKMTGASVAKSWEIALFVFLGILQIAISLQNHNMASVVVLFFQILLLVEFLIRRFLVYKKVPFENFLFIPTAILQLLFGLLYYFFLEETQGERMLLLLSGEAFIMNLIIGLGSRLIPVISRLPNALLPNQIASRKNWYSTLFVLVFLNIGYHLEVFSLDTRIGAFLRFIAVLFGAWKFHGAFRMPAYWSVVGIGLKFSIVIYLINEFLHLTQGQIDAATKHLVFIGCFTLTTVLISFRVILAHGGQDLNYEVRSTRLAFIIIFIIIAMVLRFMAGNFIQGNILLLSISCFMIALFLWFQKFLWIKFYGKA